MYLSTVSSECVKSKPLYTKEFHDALAVKYDKRPHRCQVCHVADGDCGYHKDGRRKKFKAVVGLCLINSNGPHNDPANVGMFCQRHGKPNPEWQKPRRLKPSEHPQLNFPDPALELGPGASATKSLGEVDGATCNDLLVPFEEPLTENTELVRSEEWDYAQICTE